MITFGEYPAFITLGMLLLEYGLGMAAVANGFSQFFALLINQSASLFIFDDKGSQLDVMALSVVLILSAALSFGVRESSLFLGWTTIIKLLFISAISITGFIKADGAYFTGNFGLEYKKLDGVFQGTAFIFFAFVAFDAVCNAVEETQKPHRIPQAIIGTVLVSTVVYMTMSASLSLIIEPDTLMMCSSDRGDLISPQPAGPPYDCSTTNPESQQAYTLAYIVAFNEKNLFWMQYVVAIAALLGITTSLLVGLYSVARLAMVAARTWLLPPPLARISPRTQTPVIAQMTLGVIISLIALAGTFNRLSEVASLGALFAMWMVSNAVLYRRYYPDVKLRYTAHGTVEAEMSKTQWWMPGAVFSRKTRRIIVIVHILLLNAMAFGYVIYYRALLNSNCIGVSTSSSTTPPSPGSNSTTITESTTTDNSTTNCSPYVDTTTGLDKNIWVISWVIAWGAVTVSMFFMCPLEYRPKTWAIKPWLLPILPSFAILLIAFSAGSFSKPSFIYFGGYAAIVTLFYIFIAMPLSYIRHFTIGPSNTEALQVVELVEVDGKYVPWDTVQSPSSGIATYMTMDPSGQGYSMYSVTRTQSASVHGENRNDSDGLSGGAPSPVKLLSGASTGGEGSDGVASMYGSLSPRRQQSYKISTKASGLPRLPEDVENEGEEDGEDDGDKKESKNKAVDSAYDGGV
jgi:amino acid transporter